MTTATLAAHLDSLPPGWERVNERAGWLTDDLCHAASAANSAVNEWNTAHGSTDAELDSHIDQPARAQIVAAIIRHEADIAYKRLEDASFTR